MFVDLPLGHTAGPPHDPVTQQRIIDEALTAAAAMTAPAPGDHGRIVDLSLRWHHDDWKASPLSWSRRQENAGGAGSDAGDTRTLRSAEPQWQSDDDRRAAGAAD